MVGVVYYVILLTEAVEARQGRVCLKCGEMHAGNTEKRYIDTLSAVASERYKKRLDLVGLQTCPFELADQEWEDDVTKWPEVEFPDIVIYIS